MPAHTFSVRTYVFGFHSEWQRGKTYQDVIRLYNLIARMAECDVNDLYRSAFARDAYSNLPGAYSWKGSYGPKDKPIPITLYAVREYED